MAGPDLNLLTTLDVLLQQGSVAGAARRLGLSASAMSRALARLREVTGDPLLVRAGRGLVPTPRATAMKEAVHRLVEDATALLRPEAMVDVGELARSFTLRASDGFAETFGPELVGRLGVEAPHVAMRFIRKLDKDSAGLRDGSIDLETGVVGKAIGPEVRAQALFNDRYVAVVRRGHGLTAGDWNAARYAGERHVLVSRQGLDLGAIDEELAAQGQARTIVTTVDGFAAALALARGSDLVATVPERHTIGLRGDMVALPLPFASRNFTVSLLWHPRLDGDPAHRWLRQHVRDVCAAILAQNA